MKTIKIENMKKTRAKRYLFFAGILILVCALMLYNAISKNHFYKNATFEQVQGEVVNIEIEEATDTTPEYYLITLKEQTEPLKLATEYNPDLKKIKDNAKAGDIIELTYDKDLLTIYRAKVGETQLYDIVQIGELENFEDKNGNGSYKASYGHDDMMMTLVQIPMLKQ